MKRVLITGANSYIGNALVTYLASWSAEYTVDTVDMIDGSWRSRSFAGYDAVFHVAGIVHQRTEESLYYAINRDLAFETAKKAKDDGVGQFIFLSSMNIYGMDTGVITPATQPAPKNHYARSKWEAEQAISPLADDHFAVAVLRPPMVYGKDCKGNFQAMLRLVKKSPIFPRLHNRRTLLHIDNLCAFVKMCVDARLSGVYFPQNREYTDTCLMAKDMAEGLGKKIYLSFAAGLAVWGLRLFLPMVRKAFGTLIYQDTEVFDFAYCVVDTRESVHRSV